MSHARYADELALRADLIYLNHAAISPWPTRTRDAVCEFARENATQGSLRYASWMTVVGSLRERLRELLRAPSVDDIALIRSTSEGLSTVAHGLDWGPGENVVLSAQEFPSNRVVWESLERYGVTARKVDLRAAESPEEALFQACDERTRLIAVSSVQYASGLRMDLERIGRYCQGHDILFCVDAIQSLGAVPMDVQAIGADFVAADGHKWMLAPEGMGVLYCRAELRPRLRLHQYGWHMLEALGDFDRDDWAPAASARRFESGSLNMLGIYGLNASLSLLLEIGLDEIFKEILKKTSYLIDEIDKLPHLEILSPTAPGRRAGILTLRHRVQPPDAVHRHLSEHGVLCAQRGGGVRVSPHFYTPLEGLGRTVELLEALA